MARAKMSRDTRRAVIWLAFTGLLIVNSFAARLQHTQPDKNTFFDWNTLAAAVFELVLLLVPALLLTRGDHRELLGLRKPQRLGRTALLGVAAIAGTALAENFMSQFGNLNTEQGVAPTVWIHGHTLEFAASLFAVAVIVPIAEETFFRGAGVGLLSRIYSVPGAVILSGCLFSLMHGLVLGFLPLAIFGAMLALMRVTSGSLFPGMVLHGAYNTLAVLVTLHWRFH
jgi:membrane protease YdiL (CAAX protease family)